MAEDTSEQRLTDAHEQRLHEQVKRMRTDATYAIPGNSSRLRKAEHLYREGAVWAGEQGFYHVKASDEHATYDIRTTCSCLYSKGRDDAWCSHRIAVVLCRELGPPQYEEQSTERSQASTEESHMPPTAIETPSSPQEPSTSQEVSAAVPSLEVLLGGTVDGSRAGTRETRPMLPSLPKRSLVAILADLSRPLPDECWARTTASEGRPAQDFLHWHTVLAVLHTYAPGWEGHIIRIEKIAPGYRDKKKWENSPNKKAEDEPVDRLAVVYRLTIHAADGSMSYDGDGMADEDKDDFGNAMNSAVAQGLKRAAAHAGVGLLQGYDKDGKTKCFLNAVRKEKERALYELASIANTKGVPRKAILAWLCRQTGVFRASDIPTHMVKSMARQLEGQPDVALEHVGHDTPPPAPPAPASLETLDEESEHIDRETGEILNAWEQGATA
jgi:hypothetical protein